MSEDGSVDGGGWRGVGRERSGLGIEGRWVWLDSEGAVGGCGVVREQ